MPVPPTATTPDQFNAMHDLTAEGSFPKRIVPAVCSKLAVVNRNLATAQTYYLDPAALCAGTADDVSNHLSVIIDNTERFPWLELYTLISGTTAPAVAPIVYAYGLNYFGDTAGSDTKSPSDVSLASYPRLYDEQGKHFLPTLLKEWGVAKAAPATLNIATLIMDHNAAPSALPRQRMYAPTVLYTAGAPRILVTTATACDVTSVLLGKLTS